MTCVVSGNLINLSAEAVEGVTVTFTPKTRALGRSGGSVTLPRDATAVSDAAGDFSVELLPGSYMVKPEGGRRAAANLVVPDEATANVSDLLDLEPEPALSDAQQAEQNAQTYASNAHNSEQLAAQHLGTITTQAGTVDAQHGEVIAAASTINTQAGTVDTQHGEVLAAAETATTKAGEATEARDAILLPLLQVATAHATTNTLVLQMYAAQNGG